MAKSKRKNPAKLTEAEVIEKAFTMNIADRKKFIEENLVCHFVRTKSERRGRMQTGIVKYAAKNNVSFFSVPRYKVSRNTSNIIFVDLYRYNDK